jgi:serine/threonine protein phosphatase 1
MRRFVMGDIHGAYPALLQCLTRSGFNYEADLLIQLGDIVDGYDESYCCVEELLKINNLICIKGNHDVWFLEFIQTGQHPKFWGQKKDK